MSNQPLVPTRGGPVPGLVSGLQCGVLAQFLWSAETQVWQQIEAQVWEEVSARVWDPVWERVSDQADASVSRPVIKPPGE